MARKVGILLAGILSLARAAVLRGPAAANATAVAKSLQAAALVNGKSEVKQPPCTCVNWSDTWIPCMRTQPRCVFIDLGAADGNTFNVFMTGGFGPLGNCPSSQWSAVLVEANPHFNGALTNIQNQHAGAVSALSSTAAYMCEAHTSFYLDADASHNYWGSTMTGNAQSQKVTVPTVNLIRLLYENTISADWVIVKMDIEGAEYDILPCLAHATPAVLIDQLYVEQHYKHLQQSEGLVGTSYDQMEAAKNTLRARGIQLPDKYFSNTL